MAGELFDRILRAIAEGKRFEEVFTPEVVDALAELGEAEYDAFELQLEAHLILNGIDLDGVKNLGKLVRAARARLDERRSSLPPAALGEQCPDAPHAGAPLFVPPGWRLSSDGVYRTDAGGAPRLRVCTSPVYVAEKLADPDRRRTFLSVMLKAAGEWRDTAVPASSPAGKVARAVADAGALVLDEKAFSRYWADFLRANWDTLPAAEEGYSLYEELLAFAADNMDRLSGGPGSWGKLVEGRDGAYLALKPEAARRFARNAGVDFEHLLAALRGKGVLLADGGSRYKTVWFSGRARRMVAVAWDRAPARAEEGDGARPGRRGPS